MLKICLDSRDEIEKQFLALLLNKNEIINITQILPKYLHNKEFSKIMEYAIECYNQHKIVNIVKMVEKHNDLNVELYLYLMDNTFYHKELWKEQLKLCEESIVKHYKEDIIRNLNESLEKRIITYEQFIDKLKKLDAIKLNNSYNSNMLTISDIDISNEETFEYVKSNTYMLDNATKGFALGQLSVWSGGNASSKSTYLNQLALESINQNYNVAIYSGELVAKRLLKWLLIQSAGKRNMSYNKEKEYWFVNSIAKDKILKWLNQKIFIYDNNCGNKAKEIISSIKECVKRNNVKVVILDNLMSMNLSSYGDDKYNVQSEFIQDLSALAKELNIHIHFVCHPRKSTTFLRKTDISGSADLTNIADNVFIMHRVNNDFRTKTKEMFKWHDDYELYNYTNVIEVVKNRDFGIEDYFVGMYFEKESKRLLNEKEEIKMYNWENYLE